MKGDWDIGNYNLIEYKIHFKYDKPIKSLIWYINLRLADWLKDKIQKIKEIKIIQKSCNPYISLITIVEVLRLNGKWKIRFYNNTIDLNKATIKNARPLSNFCMIFDKLKKAVVYIIMNMVVGY